MYLNCEFEGILLLNNDMNYYLFRINKNLFMIKRFMIDFIVLVKCKQFNTYYA